MATFKIGDVVQLKSGGPKMTITNPDVDCVYPTGRWIQCKWFGADFILQTELFKAEMLIVILFNLT